LSQKSKIQKFEPFSLPFYKITIGNWKTRKAQLLELVNWNDPDCQFVDHFTDYHKNVQTSDGRAPYTKKFIEILKPELASFAKKVEGNIHLTGLWAQRYQLMQHMEPHTHGSKGYSAVLYAEMEEGHEPTVFWAPYQDPIAAGDLVHRPYAKEGDMILFPSMLIHYASNNLTQANRTIFSFNCDVQPSQKSAQVARPGGNLNFLQK